MHGLWGLIVKDLRLLAADRKSLLVNLIIPLVLASFMGYLFAPRKGPATALDLGVIDLDRSAASRRLVETLAADPALRVVRLTEAEARRRIETGKLGAAVVLPPGTGAHLGLTALFGAEKPTLPLLVDPSRRVDAQVLEGLLTKAVMQEVGRAFGSRDEGIREFRKASQEADKLGGTAAQRSLWRQFFGTGVTALEAMPAGPVAGAGQDKGGAFQMPLRIEARSVTRQGARWNSYAHSFAGMIVMYLFFVAGDGGLAVLDEKRRGTWRRLRTAPTSRASLLVAKVTSTFAQALIVAITVYLFGWLVFGVTVQGPALAFVLTVILCALVASAFALLLMGVGRSAGQVRGYGVMAVLMMSFLGGAWFPSFIMPEWLQQASMAVPVRWMMDAFHATTWRGLGWDALLLPWAAMVGFIGLFTAVGLAAFRWDD